MISSPQHMDFGINNSGNIEEKNEEKNKKSQEYAQQQEQLKNSLLSSVLDQEARARLSNISLAKPDKGKVLENIIVQMAQYGRIQNQMNEAQLIKLLEQISNQQKPKTTVKFERRKIEDDSENEE